MSDDRRRVVSVPGQSVEIRTIVKDVSGCNVFAVNHAGEWVVLFTAPGSRSCRVMTEEEADLFMYNLRTAYEAIKDDDHIARMENEFKDE